MQAVVKTPRIEISVRGAAIPPRLIQLHKTPDSCLEMQRQPGGLKQVYA
jgi:hypothetical protein